MIQDKNNNIQNVEDSSDEVLAQQDVEVVANNGEQETIDVNDGAENATESDIAKTTSEPDVAEHERQLAADKRKKTFEKVVNWVLIAAIVILVAFNLLRIFVVTEVTIQQNSMQPTFDPNDRVLVNKLKQVQTSDVVVVYKNDVDKFVAYFAPSSEKGSGGKYELLIKRAVAVGGDTIYIEPITTLDGVRYGLVVQKNGITYKEFYVWDTDVGVTEYGKCADCVAGKYVLAENEQQAQQQGKYVLRVTMSPSSVGILSDYTQDNKYTLAQGQLLCMGDNRDRSNDSRQMGFSTVSRLLGVVVKQTHDE